MRGDAQGRVTSAALLRRPPSPQGGDDRRPRRAGYLEEAGCRAVPGEPTDDPEPPPPKLGHPARAGLHALVGDGSARSIPKGTDAQTCGP